MLSCILKYALALEEEVIDSICMLQRNLTSAFKRFRATGGAWGVSAEFLSQGHTWDGGMGSESGWDSQSDAYPTALPSHSFITLVFLSSVISVSFMLFSFL